MKVFNCKITLKHWSKGNATRVYVNSTKADGGNWPGKGHDGGYFDTDGWHEGNDSGILRRAQREDLDGWAKVKAEAERLLSL